MKLEYLFLQFKLLKILITKITELTRFCRHLSLLCVIFVHLLWSTWEVKLSSLNELVKGLTLHCPASDRRQISRGTPANGTIFPSFWFSYLKLTRRLLNPLLLYLGYSPWLLGKSFIILRIRRWFFLSYFNLQATWAFFRAGILSGNYFKYNFLGLLHPHCVWVDPAAPSIDYGLRCSFDVNTRLWNLGSLGIIWVSFTKGFRPGSWRVRINLIVLSLKSLSHFLLLLRYFTNRWIDFLIHWVTVKWLLVNGIQASESREISWRCSRSIVTQIKFWIQRHFDGLSFSNFSRFPVDILNKILLSLEVTLSQIFIRWWDHPCDH